MSVDYPVAAEVSPRQTLTDCQWSYELVRRMCMWPWKETWETDPARIVLSGSSLPVIYLKTEWVGVLLPLAALRQPLVGREARHSAPY